MRRIFLLMIVIGLFAACRPAAIDTSNAAKFKLSSPNFADSGSIPQKYTCQGDNASPELNWSEAPDNTRSFVLIMDDPDAPGGTLTHWILFDIPANVTQVVEGAQPLWVGGNNGMGKTGYTGPCPPSGVHRYYFRLYALDVPTLFLKAGAIRATVEAAMEGHIIGEADTMGRYEQQ